MHWLHNRDRIGALLMLVISIAYFAQIDSIRLLPFLQDATFTPRTLPHVLSIIGIILSLLLLFKPVTKDEAQAGLQKLGLGRAVLLCVVMIIYGFSVRPLGFVFTTTLFLVAGFLIMGERRWKLILIASLPIAFSFWYLMDQILDISIQAMPEWFGE